MDHKCNLSELRASGKNGNRENAASTPFLSVSSGVAPSCPPSLSAETANQLWIVGQGRFSLRRTNKMKDSRCSHPWGQPNVAPNAPMIIDKFTNAIERTMEVIG
jgi:hypothetical protein